MLKVTLSFQRIIYFWLGIKLSKQEIKAHQNVVNAEIFIGQSQQLNTSICRVQTLSII